MKAVLLISHGSRSKKAAEEVRALARCLKEESGHAIFEIAFLEVDEPGILQAIAACVEKGATDITLLLHFLNSGNHILKDIPACIEAAQARYPSVKFETTPFVGCHPQLKSIYLDLLNLP